MVKLSESAAMVAYAAAFWAELSLHLREIKPVYIDAMFNDAEDLESNMRASGIQLKTIYDPLEIR